jgi:hypothetical protein
MFCKILFKSLQLELKFAFLEGKSEKVLGLLGLKLCNWVEGLGKNKVLALKGSGFNSLI